MKNNLLQLLRYSVVLFGLALVGSCIPAAKPLFLDSSFHSVKIDTIAVLPVADMRTDKSLEISKVDQWRVRPFRNALTRARYASVYIENRALVDNIAEEDLEELDPSWIKKLNPGQRRWVLLPIIYGSHKQVDIGKKVQLEIAAALFDVQTGKRIWFHKDAPKCSGGLLMPGVMQDCIQTSYWALAMNLPKQ